MRTRQRVYCARNGAQCGMCPESLSHLGGQLRVCGIVLRRRDLLVSGCDNPLRAVGGLPPPPRQLPRKRSTSATVSGGISCIG
jgi:hypothetical protein